MKNTCLILLCSQLVVLSPILRSETIYDGLKMGAYQVGYCDTILFDSSSTYQAYEYSGPTPIFTHIWFPVEKSIEAKYLTFGELKHQSVPDDLKAVYSQWQMLSSLSFIEYNLLYDVMDENELTYSVPIQRVYQAISDLPTKSISMDYKSTGNYPVILYHHGSQSQGTENYVLAEYLASQGYVVVSADMHLVLENRDYGAIPWGDSFYPNKQVKPLLKFCRKIAGSQKLVYCGHSYGAQVGFSILYEAQLADAFISLETTLEHQTDTAHVQEFWTNLYAIIQDKHAEYPLPILAMASTQNEEPFHFIHAMSSVHQYEFSTKNYFAHNSYTAIYLLRYFLAPEYHTQDRELLKTQLELYKIHLEIISSFIRSVVQAEKFKPAKFKKNFYFRDSGSASY